MISSLANQNTLFDKVVKEGKTDAEGNAAMEYLLCLILIQIWVLAS